MMPVPHGTRTTKMKITRRQLRRIIQEQLEDDHVIAGKKIKYASKSDIQAKVVSLKRKLVGRHYADTHELWSAKSNESPEEVVERFVKWASGGFPGRGIIYQDPDTGEVFGHARYNTF